jgi:hypothetical protein
MRPEIGREMTIDQIREKLAGAGGGSGGGGGASNQLADPGTTEDIDGLVDDLLG